MRYPPGVGKIMEFRMGKKAFWGAWAACIAGGLTTLSGCPTTRRIQTGLTGIDLQVKYEKSLKLDLLKISLLGGTELIDEGELPDDSRTLAEGGESAVVLVDEDLDSTEIQVRVDGLLDGQIKASQVASVTIKKKELVALEITLGKPAVAGDGIVHESLEICDDGNEVGGDGCDAEGQPETGFSCTGEPSTCVTTCGDGVQAGAEACDDGNVEANDGCDNACALEADWN
jgi:cysteine-rich repeat protein